MEIDLQIDQIFERADIKQFRKFVLDGSMIEKYSHGTYQEHLEIESEDIIIILRKHLKDSEDGNQLIEAMQKLNTALLAYRDVFTEIGMKVGARLLFQLLHED